jgi:hypothetical protein
MLDHVFISKTLFFPNQGILTIGDLHLGYDYMLQQAGISVPSMQTEDMIKEFKEIFTKIEKNKFKLKKVVFLGDIKHSFGFEKEEMFSFRKVADFISEKVGSENLILIRGNHDTIEYSFGKMQDYFIQDGIAFVHGNESFLEIYDEKIKIIVMGHIHPSVILSDKSGIKKERFKCFLKGNFKKKEVFILPSFLESVEGTLVNNYNSDYDSLFSIIPKKDLLKFEVFVIGEDDTYGFGKVKDLN